LPPKSAAQEDTLLHQVPILQKQEHLLHENKHLKVTFFNQEVGIFAESPQKEKTSFRKLYDRGDFPISVNHDAKGNKINWKVYNFDLG
jgi:hypothetical protein